MTEAEWIEFFRRPEIPAFNAKMLEHPDADLPRLVFADWVEENCSDTAFVTAIRESLTTSPWIAHFPTLPSLVGVDVRVHRGRLVVWLDRSMPPPKPRARTGVFPFLWRSGWVGEMSLWRASPAAFKAWLAEPQMAFVERLRIGTHKEASARAIMVANAPHLHALAELDLSSSSLTLDDLRRLSTSVNAPRLKKLDLSSNGITSNGAGVIASAAALAGLTCLVLDNNRIGTAGVEALASSPHLTGLATLDLDSDELEDDAVAALAGSPLLARLSDLNLARNRIGTAGVQALCRSSRVKGLKRLCITGNRNPGPDAMRAVADCPHLAGLTTLEVGANWATDDGVRALAGSPHLARLQQLDLGFSQMTESGAKALAASAHLRDLRGLEVGNNKIGDAGFIALLAAPALEKLTRLGLYDCGITSKGAQALAASPRLANLTRPYMMLGENDYGVRGATALAESPHLRDETEREYFRRMAEWFRHQRKK